MTAILVDSSVILDVVTHDPRWAAASARALSDAADRAPLIVNPLVYAEVSVGFDTIEALEEAVPAAFFRREPLPWEAAFLAGKCFVRYRRRGGGRRSPLPDLYIGAHAAVRRYELLTRDPKRFRSYFPTVKLLLP